MYQETITESTHGEYDIFNEHSGQSYVVSYDVNPNEGSYIVKVFKKHISTENGHTLKDFSTITECSVKGYSIHLSMVRSIGSSIPSKKESDRFLLQNTKKVASTFALALEKNDIACLGIISKFDNVSIKMQNEAMDALNDIIDESSSPYGGDFAMRKEIEKAWEYVDLTMKNRKNNHEQK